MGSPRLMLRLVLIPTTLEDTEDTDTDMASVRLRLSPRLMLRQVLIPTTWEDTRIQRIRRIRPGILSSGILSSRIRRSVQRTQCIRIQIRQVESPVEEQLAA